MSRPFARRASNRRSSATPSLAIAIEAQLRPDPRKRFTWPVYLTTLRARYECSALVLVVSAEDEVARWCAESIDFGAAGMLRMQVLGPRSIPIVTDVAEASRSPELAVLSAVAHASDPPEIAAQVAFAAISAVRDLDDEHARFYADLIDSRLSDAARAALEDQMQKHEYQGPFARKYFAEGREEGREEGRIAGRAEAILVLFASRGIAVSESARVRILACRDLATLDRWLVRAADASSIDDVLDS